MWSSRRSVLAKLTVCATVGGLMAGCVEPLYGSLGAGVLEQELRAIKVEPIPDRFGHYVAQELIFGLNGSGAVVAPKYRLVVTLKQRVQAPIVDTVTSRATAASLVADASFGLFPIGGGPAILEGVAFSVASFTDTGMLSLRSTSSNTTCTGKVGCVMSSGQVGTAATISISAAAPRIHSVNAPRSMR